MNVKLPVMYFSPFPCYLVLLELEYLPQHPILKHTETKFHTHT